MADPTLKVRTRLTKTKRIRIAMIAFFILAGALILPKDFVPALSYEEGKPWVAPSLKSDFDFALYKTDSEINAEKLRVRESVAPVFMVDSLREDSCKEELDAEVVQFFARQANYTSLVRQDSLDRASAVREEMIRRYRLDPRTLLSTGLSVAVMRKQFRQRALDFADDVYEIGLVDSLRGAMKNKVISIQPQPNRLVLLETVLVQGELEDFLRESQIGLVEWEFRLFSSAVLPRLRPNLTFSQQATRREQDRVEGLISPVKGKVAKGETIINKGERVDALQDLKIRSYIRARTERFGSQPYFNTLAGQLVVVSLVTLLLMLFVRNNRPRIYFNTRKLALLLLVFLTMAGVVVLVLKLTLFTQEIVGINFIYLAPACMVPIILNAFFDPRVAFFGNLTFAVFAGSIIPNGYEYVFVQLGGGTAAVYSLTKLRNRADFFIALSVILLAYVVTYIGYNFYTKGSFSNIYYLNLALFALNVVLTFITYPLIYVFEKIFGLTSDLTFIELLDTNHPLLKELSVRAPGTFQHSLQVANLTEAVLNKIGGNSLKAKVGALFHDVGKMQNPLCFIENLGDQPNPHLNMSYQESAEKIIAHVADGVKLAHEHNLPSEVIDFIKTHHGTTRTEYFYRKTVEENPDVEVHGSDFSYPGPLPFSREMAVLMIADSIEAASRSMKDRSQEKLLALVENIVEGKVRQRQFNQANLTFRDIEDAKMVIYNMLVSMHHGRIEYPKEPKEEASDANLADEEEVSLES